MQPLWKEPPLQYIPLPPHHHSSLSLEIAYLIIQLYNDEHQNKNYSYVNENTLGEEEAGRREKWSLQEDHPTASGGKAMYTVMFCVSSAGEYLPPYVVYKAKNLHTTWMTIDRRTPRDSVLKWLDGKCCL